MRKYSEKAFLKVQQAVHEMKAEAMIPKNMIYTLALLIGLALGSCNSEQKARGTDSIHTDTAHLNDAARDSVSVVDSLGLGTTPGTQTIP